jgi:hypothetical protein
VHCGRCAMHKVMCDMNDVGTLNSEEPRQLGSYSTYSRVESLPGQKVPTLKVQTEPSRLDHPTYLVRYLPGKCTPSPRAVPPLSPVPYRTTV